MHCLPIPTDDGVQQRRVRPQGEKYDCYFDNCSPKEAELSSEGSLKTEVQVLEFSQAMGKLESTRTAPVCLQCRLDASDVGGQ